MAIELIPSFVLGTAIGSFCNVVIFRLHAGGSPFRGRSRCPHCRKELLNRDLVPLFSFLALRRRCRFCRKLISWQYPLVELAMGVLTLVMTARFGLSVAAAVGTVMAAFLLVIFVYDLKHELILDRVSIPALVVALIGSVLLPRTFSAIALGGILGAGFFLLQYVLSKGQWIGGGDIRLGGVLGLMLGWPLIVVALVVAYLSGAVVSFGLLLARRRTLGSVIPFGTFLSLAGVVTYLWGNEMMQWYLHGDFLRWFASTFLRY